MQRFDFMKVSPGGYRPMADLEQYIHQSGLEESLLHLIKLRASQINGCAYCLDMHWKDLRANGEKEQRLYGLDAWREAPWGRFATCQTSSAGYKPAAPAPRWLG